MHRGFGVCVPAYGNTVMLPGMPYTNMAGILRALSFVHAQYIRTRVLRDDDQLNRMKALATQVDLDIVFGAEARDQKIADQLMRMASTIPASRRRYLESVNEWNLFDKKDGDPDPAGGNWWLEARAQVKAVRAAMNKVSGMGSIPLLSPSIGKREEDSFRRLGDVRSWVDRGNIHMYDGCFIPGTKLPAIIGFARRYNVGNKPIVLSEYGYQNAMNCAPEESDPVTEGTAGVHVLRTTLEAFFLGIEAMSVYELFDDKREDALKEEQIHFGLFHYDGTPKPAARTLAAYQTLLTRTGRGGLGHLDRLPMVVNSSAGDLRVFTAKRSDGSWLVFIWRQVASAAANGSFVGVPEVPVTLDWGYPRYAVWYRPSQQGLTPMGQSQESSTTIKVGSHPVIVEVGAKR